MSLQQQGNQGRRRCTAAVPQLPEQLVACVLRHVPQHECLASCSLVCKSWRAAANATVECASLIWDYANSDSANRSRAASLERWLAAHGSTVTRLMLDGDDSGKLSVRLPAAQLQNLQTLRASRCRLQLQADSEISRQQENQLLAAAASASSSSSSSNSQHPLSSLTALDLNSVVCSLAGLPALEKLRSLQLWDTQAIELPQQQQQQQQQQQDEQQQAEDQQEEDEAAQIEQAWQQYLQQLEAQRSLHQNIHRAVVACTQLTRLQLNGELLLEGPVGPFSCLQQLQDLDLAQHPLRLCSTLAGLPPSLTKLLLSWEGEQQQQLSCAAVPALSALTALQELQIQGFGTHGVRPDFLQGMRQLQELRLTAGLSRDALLLLCDALPLLGELRCLTFRVAGGEADAVPASNAARYAALLPASQDLSDVEVCWDAGVQPLLVAGCAQRMFAAGQQRKQLHRLALGMSLEWCEVAMEREAPHEVAEFASRMPAFFGPGDVARLVACCPSLQTLSIPGLVAPGVDLSPLLSLQQLECLIVGGAAVDDGAASSVLANMMQLKRLVVVGAPQLTDQGLLALTALKGLRELELVGCGISSSVSGSSEGYLALYYEDGGAPSVWLQLLARCLRSDTCVAEATAQLLAYHEDTEERLAAQQQQQQQLRS